MKLNRDIFHDFSYSAKTEQKGRANVHYIGRHFFSYSTQIGYLYNETGRPVLLVSENSFSRTTAEHRMALIMAAPMDRIDVPFDWYDNFVYDEKNLPRIILERFTEHLLNYKAESFRLANNRRDFLDRYWRLRKFLQVTGQKLDESTETRLNELTRLAEDTEENRRARRQQSAKLAAKTRKKNEAARENRKKLLAMFTDSSVISLVLLAFGQKKATQESTIARDELVRRFGGMKSYVWPEDSENVRTSQGVKLPVATARRMLALWKAGRATVGMHVGPYSVREIGPEFVQIGCHCIPVENLRELDKALNA